MEPRSSRMLGKYSTTELYRQPTQRHLDKDEQAMLMGKYGNVKELRA
jgi:hypothetical protein